MAERNRLLCEIETAVHGVRLGNGISLHQARAFDDYESDAAAIAARTFDTEETWQEIPDEKIECLGDTLPFLDAEGFRFYFPRFMVYTLHHHPGSGPQASASAIYFADQPDFAKAYSLLSPRQLQVVRDFAALFRSPATE